MAANADGVLVSGADNGTMFFWDWKTGYNFQRLQAPVQPGSLDSEAGIFAMTFDQVGFVISRYSGDLNSGLFFIYFSAKIADRVHRWLRRMQTG